MSKGNYNDLMKSGLQLIPESTDNEELCDAVSVAKRRTSVVSVMVSRKISPTINCSICHWFRAPSQWWKRLISKC